MTDKDRTTRSPAALPAWRKLAAHRDELQPRHLRELFAEDPGRAARLTYRGAHPNDGLLVDFSKQRVTAETLGLLLALAGEAGIEDWRARLFAGEAINNTEGRAVLHMALRNRSDRPMKVDGEDVMPAVRKTLAAMKSFVDDVRAGERRGATGKPFTHVVNIGIGGSDLGPLMIAEALKGQAGPGPEVRFVSNVDAAHLEGALKGLAPETTLVVVISKTFTTLETMMNARTAQTWLRRGLASDADAAKHFVAVSAAPDKAKAFGVSEVFGFWDWVGGRYSLWSAVGLPIALGLGFEAFEDLLSGAHAMDEHFRTARPEENLPLLMALIGLWNTDFLGAESQAVLPYSQSLHRLPAYLQQAEMESNGKAVNRDGDPVGVATCPIIWGEPGTNGQHAFFQLLHQGTPLVPSDFIIVARGETPHREHQQALVANALAQTAALMQGRTAEEARAVLKRSGKSEAEIERLLPHKVFPGNRPSTTILLDALTPHRLGQLVALYEHKIFCQGVLWGLNSFDQWGVELGKELAGSILPDLTGDERPEGHDPSTTALIEEIRKLA